ncbi:MAG: hypothetical protein ABSB74_01355 [Tepidisphaeraceae bacterium]
MSDTHQLQQDLHYVREVVTRAERWPRGRVGYWIWALYVLIGYPLIDLAPRYARPFFIYAGVVCLAASLFVQYRHKKSAGVRTSRNRAGLFWLGGSLLIVLCAIAICVAIPGVRGQAPGQIVVMMVGIFYFLGGVHYDRNFLWLGPVLCVGGVLVGFVPHYGWTALGIVFALGLMGPTLFAPRPPKDVPESIPA